MLDIKNLKISINDKEIVKGINLSIKPGEIHAIMGPNGAGKTTLAMGIMGNPGYKIKDQRSKIKDLDLRSGQAKFKINNLDMLNKLPEERARAGLFVSFQHPVEITGVSFLAFLRTARKALYPNEKVPLSIFKQTVKDALKKVDLSESFMSRSLNEGFSGGEKKRAEIAQLIVLKPKYVILDEIDSGLDVDSLKIVANAVKEIVKKEKIGILLITHYQRILYYLRPDYVHILIDGKIKKSGDAKLVKIIEKNGYAAI